MNHYYLKRRLAPALLSLFLLSTGITTAADENTTLTSAEPVAITLTCPSVQETTIAPGRSFYVKGSFSNIADIPEDSTVTVSLTDASGNEVRSISTSIKNNKTVAADLITFKTDATVLEDTGMPDLVWDGADTSTIQNGDIKCFYDDSGFAALIPGGKTDTSIDDKLSLVDKTGTAYPALPEGSYTLQVSITTPSGENLGDTQQAVTIGNTPDKILTRFSGDAHISKFEAFAKANGYRIYNDYFPGYWPISDELFCENAPQWRAADATEYTYGNVHFIIYNVKKSSTTYGVELGLLQKMGDIDTRLSNYYYSTGEPGVIGGVDSSITPFQSGDKLQLVRAEMQKTAPADGVYDETVPELPAYDMDLSDGVTANSGEFLSIYGVTAPIQLSQTDIITNEDNTFTLNNKIQTVKYEITGNGTTQTYEKNVMLNRVSSKGTNPSELEFRHVIPLDFAVPGNTYTINVEGFDVHGSAVAGTKESFQLTAAKSNVSPTPPTDQTNTDTTGTLPVEKTDIKPADTRSVVKTGDSSNLFLPLSMMGLCAAAIIITRRKHIM